MGFAVAISLVKILECRFQKYDGAIFTPCLLDKFEIENVLCAW